MRGYAGRALANKTSSILTALHTQFTISGRGLTVPSTAKHVALVQQLQEMMGESGGTPW